MTSLNERYAHKIKTAEALRDLIGPMPRQKRAIICHGVFDVVHPGHVRHLLYAKSKAPIVIASLTADRHITKGAQRPHVPQHLRALNLAAFEMVDFVLIDANPTPIENLKIIKPDYLAKGFEYNAQGLAPKTLEESEVMRSIGGEVIFSPGDIVYSSSKFIEMRPPSLRLDKLHVLMGLEKLTFSDLHRTLHASAGRCLHVVGDTIIDSHTYCTMIGGQTKTPTMSVLFERRSDFVGGAAIVAKHCRAAGADVVFSTVVGDDDLARMAIDSLEATGIKVFAATDRARPTVNKNSIIVENYRLLKIDTLDNRTVSDEILKSMLDHVRSVHSDAVIYADFRHGIFNRRTIPSFVAAIPEGVYKVADSQVASRWGNILEFGNFDLITPNEREARFALGDQDSGIGHLASELYERARCKTLILKLGERGLFVCKNGDVDDIDRAFGIDNFVEHLVDPVGAGDALLAYSTLAMLTSQSETQAAILGAVAAACECECDGNVPVTPELVATKLQVIERQMSYAGGR